MLTELEIIKATSQHLEVLAYLFDRYRIFYHQKPDLEGAYQFLERRMEKNESTIFLANFKGEGAGFTQLYPVFSSVSMERSFILNDLFVLATYRNLGIGAALLSTAKTFTRKMNYKGLALETAIDNPAQKLYEREGWKRDEDFLHYFWKA